MKNWFSIVACFLITHATLLAQQNITDSLESVLKISKDDTGKVNLLNDISKAYRDNSPEKSIDYANKAISLAEKLDYEKGIANAWHNMGGVYLIKGEYLKAIKQYQKAIVVRESINDKDGISSSLNNIGLGFKLLGNYDSALAYHFRSFDIDNMLANKKGIAYDYANIGSIYKLKGEYQKALGYFLQSTKTLEEINDKYGIAAITGNMGALYRTMNQHEKALEYEFISLKNYEELENNNGIASTLNNIGNTYDDLNNYEKAIEYHTRSIKIRESIGDPNGVSTSLINLANLYTKQKQYDKALENYFKALEIARQTGDKTIECASLIFGGRTYNFLSQYNSSLDYLEKGLALAEEIGAKDLIQTACLNFSETYASQRNYALAYEYHKKYSEMKDSLLNEESSKQITEMQTKYETEKKEQQITLLNKDKELQDAQLNRQKIIIWSVAGGLLVVMILSIFIFRERRKSEKLLLNILPAETARELKANGKAKAKHYESVTVMFTDFKGFTSIAEKLSAEELVSELDFLFRKFDEIISKYPIEKIKTIGDAYMCASGLPTPNANHAEYITKAAVEIQTWMQSQNKQWQLRIGIHTGPVTAGVVGDKKFAYDIWGDTVNTASRMESSGEPNKINISGATHELIKDKFKCEFRGKIPAKNKGEIEMYFMEQNSI